LYNVLGKQIAILLAEARPAGIHQFQFDARDLTSGVYWYILRADKFSDLKKIVLLK
jgi:hypothetical protein